MNPQDFIAQLTAGPILSEKVPTTTNLTADQRRYKICSSCGQNHTQKQNSLGVFFRRGDFPDENVFRLISDSCTAIGKLYNNPTNCTTCYYFTHEINKKV